MPESSRDNRCQILLELAEKMALEDPQRRKLYIIHVDGRQWQVTLGGTSEPERAVFFPTLEQALEDFVLHWQRPWLYE